MRHSNVGPPIIEYATYHMRFLTQLSQLTRVDTTLQMDNLKCFYEIIHGMIIEHLKRTYLGIIFTQFDITLLNNSF